MAVLTFCIALSDLLVVVIHISGGAYFLYSFVRFAGGGYTY